MSRATALKGLAELGRLYHANGFFPAATSCWELLRREQPDEPRWAYLLGDSRRAAGDYERMETNLREVVRLAPGYAPAWLRLAGHLLKTGRADEAAEAFRRRLQFVPGDPYARLGLARVALQDGDAVAARAWLAGLVQDHPQFTPAHNLMAEMLDEAGDGPGAERHRRLGRLGPAYVEAADPWLDELTDSCCDVERLRTLASVQFHGRVGDRGVGLMRRAVGLEPDNGVLLAALGDLYIKLGDAGRARESLERALHAFRGAKPPIMVFVNLSHSYRQLGQLELARGAAQRGLALHPDAFELNDELGIVYGELGYKTEAVESFTRAVRLEPGDANANCNLALALLRDGRPGEAREALERSLRRQPTFPQALAMLAQLNLQEGHFPEAESCARALSTCEPGHPAARQVLGACRLAAALRAEQRGATDEAEKAYRDGIAVDASNALLHRGLGVLLLLQGKAAESIPSLSMFQQLQPDLAEAALLLGEAQARAGNLEQARSLLRQSAAQARRSGDPAVTGQAEALLEQLR